MPFEILHKIYEQQNLIWSEILWDLVMYNVYFCVIMKDMSITKSFAILHRNDSCVINHTA